MRFNSNLKRYIKLELVIQNLDVHELQDFNWSINKPGDVKIWLQLF